jgi:ubiquinone/menaquinone biosynthesis C-methylase UbiE
MTAEIVAGSRFHESLAEGWSSRYGSGSFKKRLEFVEKDLATVCSNGARWLDAGCGSGVFTNVMVAKGAAVVAVDASPAMLEQARRAVADSAADVTFAVVKTIEKLPFPSESFDGVICLSVLEYVMAPKKAVRELHRILKPGGQILATVPNSRSAIRGWQSGFRFFAGLFGVSIYEYLSVSQHSFTASQLRLLFTDCGFQQQSLRMFSPVLPAPLNRLGMGALWSIVAVKSAPQGSGKKIGCDGVYSDDQR